MHALQRYNGWNVWARCGLNLPAKSCMHAIWRGFRRSRGLPLTVRARDMYMRWGLGDMLLNGACYAESYGRLLQVSWRVAAHSGEILITPLWRGMDSIRTQVARNRRTEQ